MSHYDWWGHLDCVGVWPLDPASLIDVDSAESGGRLDTLEDGIDGHDDDLSDHLHDPDAFNLLSCSYTRRLQGLAARDDLHLRRAIVDAWLNSHDRTIEQDDGDLDPPAAVLVRGTLELDDAAEYESDYDPVHFSISIRSSASPHSPMSSMESSTFLSSSNPATSSISAFPSSSASSWGLPRCMPIQLFGQNLVDLDGISGGIEGYFFISAPLKLADPDCHLGNASALAIDGCRQAE